MARGYSVRNTWNYYKGKDGKWKGHSIGVWDDKGRTKVWSTVEAAEEYARDLLNRYNNPDDEQHIQYCKIYLGYELIKTITR